MGVLLGRSSVGKQLLATCRRLVVPSGMSLRGPDMSLDMACWLSQARQRFWTGPNAWLWAWATHLAETRRWARLRQPRTSPHPRADRVAGCRKQLVRPWLPMHSRAEARTLRKALGACLRARMSRPSLPALWLCACPQGVLMVVGGLRPLPLARCCGSLPTLLQSRNSLNKG